MSCRSPGVLFLVTQISNAYRVNSHARRSRVGSCGAPYLLTRQRGWGDPLRFPYSSLAPVQEHLLAPAEQRYFYLRRELQSDAWNRQQQRPGENRTPVAEGNGGERD